MSASCSCPQGPTGKQWLRKHKWVPTNTQTKGPASAEVITQIKNKVYCTKTLWGRGGGDLWYNTAKYCITVRGVIPWWNTRLKVIHSGIPSFSQIFLRHLLNVHYWHKWHPHRVPNERFYRDSSRHLFKVNYRCPEDSFLWLEMKAFITSCTHIRGVTCTCRLMGECWNYHVSRHKNFITPAIALCFSHHLLMSKKWYSLKLIQLRGPSWLVSNWIKSSHSLYTASQQLLWKACP